MATAPQETNLNIAQQIVFQVLEQVRNYHEPSLWAQGYRTACNEIAAKLAEAGTLRD